MTPDLRCSKRSRRGHVTLGDVKERMRQVLKQILLERYPDKWGCSRRRCRDNWSDDINVVVS